MESPAEEKMKRHLRAADQALKAGDVQGALDALGPAASTAREEPELSYSLGWINAATATAQSANEAMREAMDEGILNDPLGRRTRETVEMAIATATQVLDEARGHLRQAVATAGKKQPGGGLLSRIARLASRRTGR